MSARSGIHSCSLQWRSKFVITNETAIQRQENIRFRLILLSNAYDLMDKPCNNLKSEIDKARGLYLLYGQACMSDERIGDRVRLYKESILRTDSMMLETGVVEACTRCAADKGSCCFTEMGESYGCLQLFVNLLLGSELPGNADFTGTCHFIGARGCKLQARHSFCLNYFCPDLKNLLGEREIMKIQIQVGEQLLMGWELERTLAERIADATRHD